MSKATHDDIADAVLEILKGDQDSQEIATMVASYLIDERRTRELNSIFRRVEERRYQESGKLEADVVGAHDLSETVRELIASKFNAKQVLINVNYNPELVGGARVRALDKQLDLSIESKLNRLKNLTVNVK